jgi:hypothetical protein
MEPTVTVTGARVDLDDGTTVAQIDAVTIGGGIRIVGQIDGAPVERADPTLHRFHCRLLSPDRMIPDQLVETESYEEAVAVGLKYAGKRAEHARQIAELAADLKV